MLSTILKKKKEEEKKERKEQSKPAEHRKQMKSQVHNGHSKNCTRVLPALESYFLHNDSQRRKHFFKKAEDLIS